MPKPGSRRAQPGRIPRAPSFPPAGARDAPRCRGSRQLSAPPRAFEPRLQGRKLEAASSRWQRSPRGCGPRRGTGGCAAARPLPAAAPGGPARPGINAPLPLYSFLPALAPLPPAAQARGRRLAPALRIRSALLQRPSPPPRSEAGGAAGSAGGRAARFNPLPPARRPPGRGRGGGGWYRYRYRYPKPPTRRPSLSLPQAAAALSFFHWKRSQGCLRGREAGS